ncbi:hypothetical protein GCM10010317_000300 [Streptomyces mirabilis]|nr:hypothetical protein GCM10010317_000300 [Streptomyces mirabilis]
MRSFLSDAVIRHLVCAGDACGTDSATAGTGDRQEQRRPVRAVHTAVGGAPPTKPAVTGVWESLMRGSLTGTPNPAEALVE